jgi:hypothetical protein
MKTLALVLLMVLCVPGRQARAQGYDDPLTIQGLDRASLHSATSRAMGATTIGVQNDITLMFTNPATLQSLTGIQASLGSALQSRKMHQTQHYAPLKYYSNFSLLMEGLTGTIPDPDTSLGGTNPGDTVKRPFDGIGPGWSRSKNKGIPIQAFVGVPFSLVDVDFVFGAGIVPYADLDHYYQNNNVLSPSILSERPLPTSRPPTDSLPLFAQWSQFARSREGSLRGYGGALSGAVTPDVSLGVSAVILRGSADDYEQRVMRGRLTFYTNYFRLDSVHGRSEKTGTSDFKGTEVTLSGIYRGKHVNIGFVVRPPMTITRSYAGEIRQDSAGSQLLTRYSGEDEVRLPWRGVIGLSFVPLQNLTLGLEYEIRPYASATYTQANGGVTHPWLSATAARIGLEYRPDTWLSIRAGVRGQTEVFEPEGNPLPGDAVSTTVYTAGVGMTFAGFHVNVAYEYGQLKFQDVWGSAISLNTDNRSLVVADVAYEIPWLP